jgi:hypothetical protein
MTWRAIWIVWPMPLTRLRDSRHARRLIGGDGETIRQAVVLEPGGPIVALGYAHLPGLTVKPPLTQMAYARGRRVRFSQSTANGSARPYSGSPLSLRLPAHAANSQHHPPLGLGSQGAAA